MRRHMPPDAPPEKKKKIPQTVLDILIAVAIVASIFLAMFAYTGSWPPLVVVESRSMQHSDTESYIGVMDTGDLVLVKKINNISEITTYYSGRSTGYATYGDYGDVVIYLRGGSTLFTPIIHRAVLYLINNPDGISFNSPELSWMIKGSDYNFDDESDTWEHITDNIVLKDYGYKALTLTIPIKQMIAEMQSHGVPLHSGYITKGDLNPQVDQFLGISTTREPIKLDWIVGVARGEIPWFGIVKLWLTGDLPSNTPGNSIGALMICIVLIIAIPASIEIFLWWRDRNKRAQSPENEPEKKTESVVEQVETPPEKTVTEEDAGKKPV